MLDTSNLRQLVAATLFLCSAVCGQTSYSLITSAVNNERLTQLHGHVHPLAQAKYDQGVAPASLPMNRMLLFLKRSAQQDEALNRFLEDLQDPASPQFHQFLTPEEFGQRFGASDSDIEAIVTWLSQQGFKVAEVSKGRTVIEFSGTAGLLQAAFHTAIHKYVVNGEEHWANANDPSIPTALAPAVLGFVSLHNFGFKPNSHIAESSVEARMSRTSPRPEFTSTGGGHYLAPIDFNTIYGVTQLSGATGAGASIAVVATSNFDLQDVISFRSVFGLPTNTPSVMVNGPDPGQATDGSLVEAVLDASWAGVAAPAATVDVVVSETTAATDGTVLSEQYIINNNLADIMTESFGSCEAQYSASTAAAVATLAQQAATQGITYLVSAGDSGSAGCDAANSASATGPVSVNILGSSAYTLTVGGTQFFENGSSQYWNSSNGGGMGSATGYIPEDVWNANCTGSVCGSGSGIFSTGGGVSKFFSKPSWQAGVVGIPNDGKRDVPDVSLSAAAHDPYLLCFNGDCNQVGGAINFTAVYGTSASAPSFAGIVALVKQRVGTRLGQIAPTLYRLAATENLPACNASNTAVPLASTCIFNDVTVGTNAVPGEANYNTSSETYNAGVGFDLATGLGSLNAANLVNAWSSGVVTAAASASYVGSDPVTQGAWTGRYGADGYVIPNGNAVQPAYGTVTPGGVSAWTWLASTSDVRALQSSSGATSRIASTFYANPNSTAGVSFSIDVNLSDGNTHHLALYLCDFDTSTRSETVTISDAVSGAVLASQTFSGFSNGIYANWLVKGHVKVQATNNSASSVNPVINGLFFDGGMSGVTSGNASWIGLDSATLGNWTGKYGADGFVIPNDLTSQPTYGVLSGTGVNTWTWASGTSDARALQVSSASSSRIASTFYSSPNSVSGTNFTIDVNLTDGNTHRLALYLCDFDNRGRSETITISDGTTGTILSTQSFSNMTGGVYALWKVSGHIKVEATNGSYSSVNAIINALFLDPPSASAPATATYSGADASTLGNWTGKYGADGVIIPNDITIQPAYGSLTAAGVSTWTWANATNDARAPQITVGSSARIASAFYAVPNSTPGASFSVDINLMDANTHRLALYLCDWDAQQRNEIITISDAVSGSVLSTQAFSNFSGGVYGLWNVSGHITVKATNNSASSVNAVLNAVFFN